MKQVKITIEGTIQICEYASTRDAFYDTFYMTLGWYTVDALYVDDNEDEGRVDECKLTRPYECQGEKIVCTETGVVDELCVKEGATVNWCVRLMTIDINAMNRHWPIVSGHAGTVSFRVKRGSRVVKGDVLAIIF